MHTKTVTIIKKSKLGNEFECTMTIHCNTDEEKEAKYQKKLAELREETRRREAMEMYEAERALHQISMDNLLDIVDEYIRNVKDFDY